ncbi:MAG: hypothetical protein Q4C46_02490 [Bacillota bacterium]|nr:hypothetical protein [Bacillota bacterium]
MIDKETILSEIDFYSNLFENYETLLAEAPDGEIYFKYDHNKWRPFIRKNNKEIYLSPKRNKELINKLLLKKFTGLMVAEIKRNLCLLKSLDNCFTDLYKINYLEKIKELENLKGHDFKVDTFMDISGVATIDHHNKNTQLTDDESRWLSSHSKLNPYMPEKRIHRSPLGTMVRSKSELSIATFLDLKGLSYKSDELLILEGHEYYPDFIIYRRSDGKIIIWEHLGMMDDPAYAEKVIHKLTVYSRNGYRLGDNLILTYDDNGSLDMTTLNSIYELMLK